ncbi:hypothetical protein J4221_01755 [Candidatus Pacearchaeota archaeon]|nr:hypothetical protein [Candidatus Pacearchaeota archaeon]
MKLNEDYCIRTLIVERNTNDGMRAISFMNSSRLPYELIEISREEANEDLEAYCKTPRLLSNVGCFETLSYIEWFSRCFGVDGPEYILGIEKLPVLGLSNKHSFQLIPAEYLLRVNRGENITDEESKKIAERELSERTNRSERKRLERQVIGESAQGVQIKGRFRL